MDQNMIDSWPLSPNYDADIECDYCEGILYAGSQVNYVITIENLRTIIAEHAEVCRKVSKTS